MDSLDDFSSDAITGTKRAAPPALAGSGVLSSADQAHSDAYERDPSVAAELKRASARATPAQRAILADPKQNGTALVGGRTAYRPAIDDFTSDGISVPSSQPAAPQASAPIPPPRASFGPFDDAANFGARMGANVGNSIYGGLKGLATLATGGGINAAADATRSAPIPVVAPNQTTAAAENVLGMVQAPLDKAADWAQRGTEDTGAAGAGVMGAISKAGISNLPLLLGIGPRGAKAAAVEQAPARGAPALVPGETPTLAHASPELQTAVANAGLPADHPAVQRYVDADTLRVPVNISRGQASGNPSMISDEMNGRGKGQAAPLTPEFLQAQGQGLAQNMRGLRDEVAPDVAPANSMGDHGQTLLDSLKTSDAAEQAAITAKYQALRDANGGQFPVDAPSLLQKIKTSLGRELLTGDAPASQMAELQRLADSGSMTMEQYLSLRRNLGNVARTSADGNTRMAAGKMIEEMEALPLQDGAAELKPLADAAREAAKARFDRIGANPALKAAVNDAVPIGEPSPLADTFFNNYVIKGRNANVANLADIVGSDPMAKQTLSAGTVDHLAGQLKADAETGKFSSDALSRALKPLVEGESPKIASLLDPAAAQEMQQISRVANAVQVQPRGSYVNNSNSTTALLAEAAKTAATHGTNMFFGGVPVGSIGRAVGARVLGARNASKVVRQTTDPAAALTSLSELAKK